MSVASEITRIQSAKSALKASINAKTDQSHQITNELIDDYADFVDSISTGGGIHTGAYKVYDYSEMLQLTGMQNGDLCYIEDTNIYPTTNVDFEECSYTIDELQSKYLHSLFIIAHSPTKPNAMTYVNNENIYLATEELTKNTSTNKFIGNMSSPYVLQFEKNGTDLFPKFTANNRYVWGWNVGGTKGNVIQSSVDGTDLDTQNPTKVSLTLTKSTSSSPRYTFATNLSSSGGTTLNLLIERYYDDTSSSYKYQTRINTQTSNYYLLIYEMPQTGYLYQYVTGTGWVDISNYGTAVNTDIKAGVTAYVNNELVTGILPEVLNPATINQSDVYNGQFFKPDEAVSGSNTYGCYLVTDTDGQHVGTQYFVNWVKITTLQSWFINNQQKVKVGMPVADVATKIGLTPSVLKAGVTILGVTGTYTGN